MARRPTEIITRFAMDGIEGVRRGFRSVESTIRDMSRRAGAATLELARRSGTAIKRQFANVVEASVSQATKRIDQATAGMKKLAVATKNVGFSALEKSAKGAFAAIGLAAAAAGAKVAAAIAFAKKSADEMSAMDLRKAQTGVSINDQSDLRYMSEKQGTGPDDLINALQSVAGNIRELERSRGLVERDTTRTNRTLRYGLRWTRRAEDGDTLQKLIDESRAAGMANIESVERRIALLQLRMRSVQRGRIANRIAARTIKNGTDLGGIREYRKQQAQMLAPMISEFQDLVTAMNGLREAMGPAGRALEDLKDAGLDANVAMSGGVEAMAEIAGALEGFDPKKQEEIVRGLFGDLTHLPVLRGGRAGVARDQAERLRYEGAATEADGVRSSEYKASELAAQRSIEGFKRTLSREITPLLSESARQFADWLAENRVMISKWVADTFVAARKIVYDVGKLISGDTNFESALFKRTAAIIEWGKTTFEKVKTVVVTIAAGVYGEIAKIFSGMDSNWAWLNTIRDAFLTIKQLAVDVFAVLSGGDAVDFTWLNTARDAVLDFFAHLQEAWGMFKQVLDRIHAAVKPILSFFNTDILTAALFLGMLRFSGILGLMTTTLGGLLGLAGRLVPAFGSLFTGVGIAAAAAAGKIALIAAGLVAAWKAGEWLGGKIAAPIVEGYNKAQDTIAATARIHDNKFMREKYAKADLDGRIGLWKAMYGPAALNGRKTRAEELAEADAWVAERKASGRSMPLVIKPDGSAPTNEELKRVGERFDGRSGRSVNFNFPSGKSITGSFKDNDVSGLEKEIKQWMRID